MRNAATAKRHSSLTMQPNDRNARLSSRNSRKPCFPKTASEKAKMTRRTKSCTQRRLEAGGAVGHVRNDDRAGGFDPDERKGTLYLAVERLREVAENAREGERCCGARPVCV